MNSQNSKNVALPSLKDTLDNFKMNIFEQINCQTVGKIEKFNPDEQTAEIKIVFTRLFEGKEYEYPVLIDCPVVILGGASGSVRVPVRNGDFCLVMFNDVNIDNWFEGAINKLPDSNRRHSISDGFALVGIRNLQNKLDDYDNDSSQINYGSTKLKLKGKVNISNSANDIKTILDTFVDTVKNIVTIGSPASQVISPASQAALDAVKSDIGSLFE